MKPADAEAAEAAGSEADPAQMADGETGPNPTNVPAWERLFFRVAEQFEHAIEKAEAAKLEAMGDDSNPLVQQDALSEAKQALYSDLAGADVFIHCRLADIKAGKQYNRYQQAFRLTLKEALFPADLTHDEITVVISPREARQLTVGCVLRLHGKLLEGGRRSFDKICFQRNAKGLPAVLGPEVLRSRRYSWQDTRIGLRYVIPFYVEEVSRLEGEPLRRFEEFARHWQEWVQDNSS